MFWIKYALLGIYYNRHEITTVAMGCCSILADRNCIFKPQKSPTVAIEVAYTLKCNKFGSNGVAV